MKSIIAALASTALLLLAAPAANATTLAQEICTTLDQEPNSVGVTIVAMALLQAGVPDKEAADIIVSAVIGVCPEHVVALNDFIVRYRGASQAVA